MYHQITALYLMVNGMVRDHFSRFSMSLLRASGFQSGQYRMIEICATDFGRLIDKSTREELASATIEEHLNIFIGDLVLQNWLQASNL